jgi:hypothetical protein
MRLQQSPAQRFIEMQRLPEGQRLAIRFSIEEGAMTSFEIGNH